MERIVIGAGLLLAAFCSGWQVRSWQCERDMAQLQAQMQEQVNTAQENALALSRELAEMTAIIDAEGVESENDIDTSYHDYLLWLQQREDSTSDSDSETSNPGNTDTFKDTCDCRQYEKSKRAYGVLQKDILTITRDCDITAVRYNELLKLALGVHDSLNK